MNYEFYLTCDEGLEPFVQQELKERFKIQPQTELDLIKIQTTLPSIYEILYTSQTINGVLLKINNGTFKELSQIELNTTKIEEIIQSQTTKIEVIRQGNHNFNSVDAEKHIGQTLQKKSQKINYDFKAPETKIIILIKNQNYYAGIDLAGRDLSKRQYNIFNHPNTIKGTIAFSALMLAGLENSVLDPYSLSGNIPIEAAIYHSNTPINYFEKKFSLNKIKSLEFKKQLTKKNNKPKKIYSLDENFKNISNQKKNAKIAGVEKHIEFSRTNIEDLDLKFYENKPDVMVTRPLENSKRISENAMNQYHKKLFEQAKIILNKKIIVTITKKEPQKMSGFKITKKFQIKQGQQQMYITRYEK